MSNGPTVTLAEAARRSHLSQATLRRWLKADKLEGAERTAEGWAIPVASLVESGAWPATTPADADDQADTPAAPDRTAELSAQVTRLTAELSASERLLEAAERNADDLRTALRMLEAAPLPAVESTPRRGRWWNRSTESD